MHLWKDYRVHKANVSFKKYINLKKYYYNTGFGALPTGTYYNDCTSVIKAETTGLPAG